MLPKSLKIPELLSRKEGENANICLYTADGIVEVERYCSAHPYHEIRFYSGFYSWSWRIGENEDERKGLGSEIKSTLFLKSNALSMRMNVNDEKYHIPSPDYFLPFRGHESPNITQSRWPPHYTWPVYAEKNHSTLLLHPRLRSWQLDHETKR